MIFNARISVVLTFLFLSLPSCYGQDGQNITIKFIPGFLERGPQQAADRTDKVDNSEYSVERVQKHVLVLPDASSIEFATMSEFRDQSAQAPVYHTFTDKTKALALTSLAATIKLFMRHFWPWYISRMGRDYDVTGKVPSGDMNLVHTDIGGPYDIQASKDLIETGSNTNTVVFGVSRGSSAAFVALAQHAQQNKSLPKAVVLESPFAEFKDVRPSGIGGFLADLVHPTDEKHDPITYAKTYPKDVPTLFVTSAQDDKVPAASVKRLAQAVANAGHTSVYLVELGHSSHKGYTGENAEDQDLYKRVAYEFYRKCGVIQNSNAMIPGINLEPYKIYKL